MRRFRHHGGSRGTYVAGDMNITNITNVTSVTNTASVSSGFHGRRRGKWHGRHKERPPKLQRFCSTLGLADRGVVKRMNSGELCHEAVKGLCYNARGVARDVRDIGGGLCNAACGFVGGVMDAIVTALNDFSRE